GKLCPMAMHTLFPMVDILRYGGTLKNDCYCCPDVDTINVFKIEKVTE
ncbi:MAG: TIGR04076 family protein, partial [Firmicutes bacterium]|nr:TIGR04076 family protein [Bacillota bacterium]